MKAKEFDQVYHRDATSWREWLKTNHEKVDGVWLIYFKKHTGRDSIDYEGAVREALCFGWIDGKVQRLDDDRYRQVFMPRTAGSTWSATRSTSPPAARSSKIFRKNAWEPRTLALSTQVTAPGSPLAMRRRANVKEKSKSRSQTERVMVMVSRAI